MAQSTMSLVQFKQKYFGNFIFEGERYTCAIKDDDVLGVYDNDRNFEWGHLDELSKQTMVNYIKALRDKGHLSYNPKAKNEPRKDKETDELNVKRAFKRLIGDNRHINKKPKPETPEDKPISEDTSVDTITLDVPLMIRLFEHTREELKDDTELHELATSIIQRSKEVTGTLGMKDWKYILSGKKLEEKIRHEIAVKNDQFPTYRADQPSEVPTTRADLTQEVKVKQKQYASDVTPPPAFLDKERRADGGDEEYNLSRLVVLAPSTSYRTKGNVRK